MARGAASQTGLGGVAGNGSVASFTITDDDSATVPVVGVQALANQEEGIATGFNLTINPPAPGGLTVSYTLTQQGGAYVQASLLGAGKTTAVPGGDGNHTIGLSTINDMVDEPTGTITIALSAGAGYNVSTSTGVASLELEDNDPTGVTLSATSNAIPETGGAKQITLTLDRLLVDGEVLAVPITLGGAADANDYSLGAPDSPPAGVTYALTGASPRITFSGTDNAPGKASFTLSAVHDVFDEGPGESVTVGVGSPTSSGSGLAGGASGAGSATFDITDDDGTPVISIEGGNRITEGGKAVFMLKASPAPQQASRSIWLLPTTP